MKNIITIDNVVNLLNDLAEKDNECIKNLCLTRIECNDLIANHKYVQVHQKPQSVGLLGILNGLFEVNDFAWGCICMHIHDDGNVSFSKNDKV